MRRCYVIRGWCGRAGMVGVVPKGGDALWNSRRGDSPTPHSISLRQYPREIEENLATTGDVETKTGEIRGVRDLGAGLDGRRRKTWRHKTQEKKALRQCLHLGPRHEQLPGHEQLETSAIYTRVSIEQLKAIHSKTHPAEIGKNPDWQNESSSP